MVEEAKWRERSRGDGQVAAQRGGGAGEAVGTWGADDYKLCKGAWSASQVRMNCKGSWSGLYVDKRIYGTRASASFLSSSLKRGP